MAIPQPSRDVWGRRAARASELAQAHPGAATLLNFYSALLPVQQAVYAAFAPIEQQEKRHVSEVIQSALPLGFVSSVLTTVEAAGPAAMAEKAHASESREPDQWRAIFEKAILADYEANPLDPFDLFVARVLLQPIAEQITNPDPIRKPPANDPVQRCGHCGALPQFALLRPEADSARRSLVCSFCLHEWEFIRVTCPWCGEQDNTRVPRYAAEELPHVRLEACDTCKKYVKAIDLSADGRAEPIVDDIATAALDLWAAEHGYTRIMPNLLGF